jgi:GT2 family glycosyltransferase
MIAAYSSHASASTELQPPPQNTTLSISIVTYNSLADELETLLRSLGQSTTPHCVMVVDNSPLPALRATAEANGASYLHVPNNVGFGAGHNLALQRQLRTSRYHLVCNPDIICTPRVLDDLCAFMDRNPAAGLVMPRILYPDGQPQHLCKLLPTPADLLLRRFLGKRGARLLQRQRERYELQGLDLSAPRSIPSLSGCFMFMRTAILQQVGLFDPRFFLYMEDVDLCRRIGAVSQTLYYPHARVIHGYAKGSYRDPHLLRLHLASAVRYFNKWGWFFDPVRSRLNRRTGLWKDPQPPAVT